MKRTRVSSSGGGSGSDPPLKGPSDSAKYNAWIDQEDPDPKDPLGEDPVTEINPLKDSNDTRSFMAESVQEAYLRQILGEPAPENEEEPEEAVAPGFQPDLDDFYGEEEEDKTDDSENKAMDFDANFLAMTDPNYEEDRKKFERPEAPELVGEEDFVFQHTETTYGLVVPEGSTSGIPEVRIFGTTASGNSVLVRDQSFKPYFYVEIQDDNIAGEISRNLELYLDSKYARSRNKVDKYILQMEPTKGRSICGWHRNAPLSVMYKITMAHPVHVAAARDCLEFANRAVTPRVYKTYEANVPFELRYMIDKKINGCEWIQLAPQNGATQVVEDRISTCQYEFLIESPSTALSPIPSSVKGDIAPMRYLSYDIEVLNKGKGFPTPKDSPCVLICAALSIMGTGIVHQAAFCLAPSHVREPQATPPTFNAIENTTTYIFTDERELLLAFSQYLCACDPEALTGWNISDFDLPYVAGRAKVLGIFDRFMMFTRILDKKVWIRESTFQSKAYGAKVSHEMLCEGRFDYDGLTFMIRGQMQKYRSYKLNHIAKETLGEQKLDVDYTQIPILYEGNDEDRTRLSYYCLLDSLLPLRILEKLMAVVNGMEQARVTGVPIKWLLSRGQGVKTFSNLLRYKQPEEHTPSRSPKANTTVTAGGAVEEPKRGYYQVPIATLDFASLYPSIMIAYNICFSTKESLKWARTNMQAPDPINGIKGDYWIPHPSVDKKTEDQLHEEREQARIEKEAGIKRKPKNKKERDRETLEAKYAGLEPEFCFVKRHIRQGVLPLLLETLLEARRNVKAMMKKVDAKKDPLLYSVLDGRQLALKVVCNSVYGFLKAFILTDKDLMAAVTSYGRHMIHTVHAIIKRDFADNDVVDCPACRRMGIDPEVAPKEGEPDKRPRTRTKAFVVYG